MSSFVGGCVLRTFKYRKIFQINIAKIANKLKENKREKKYFEFLLFSLPHFDRFIDNIRNHSTEIDDLSRMEYLLLSIMNTNRTRSVRKESANKLRKIRRKKKFQHVNEKLLTTNVIYYEKLTYKM